MCILGASAGGGNTNGRGGGIAAAVRKIVRGSLDPQPVKGAGSPLRAGGQLGFLYTSSSMAAASSKPPASSRFGASQEYPLATAASMNSSSRKWVLNGKNDVVEVVDAYHLMNSPYQQQQQQQQQQQGYLGECGRLMRYNSAPSSLLSDLDHMARSLNESSGNNSHNGNPAIFNNDLPPLPTTLGLDKRNPLVDPFSNNNNNAMAPSTSRFSGQSSGVSLGMGNVGMDHAGAGFGVDSNHGFTGLLTGSSTMTTAGLSPACSMQATSMATPPQVVKTGNLIRQSSSPASLLSRLEIDHQVGHAGTGSSEEDSPLLRSPNDAMSADDMLGGGMELGGVDCGFWDGSNSAAVAAAVGHGSLFMNSTIRKRIRDEVSDIDTTHQQQQQQHTLTRHLSLPISTRSGNILPENLLQDAVPCRLRAKRGCATHPRSIAERVRRTRITERMRKLQELVPNSDKQQTNTSDMLDEAVEYVKYLQRRNEELLQELSECRDKCQGLCKMSNASQ